MKLLKIRIRNLNSLRGSHELDFTQPPLSEQGLFLITGETGAGKTTILDAITLALYGKTPRAQNWTSGSEREVLSHGQKECLAEVEFESEGRQYRSSWQFGLTRTGNPKTPKRELAEIHPTEQILASKHNEVDEQVERILKGLDYKRFIRSVLLAQGDFTEFLKGEEQRSLILERVTNTSIYTEIGHSAYLRFKQEKAALERLQLRLGDLKYLSEEEREAVEQEKKTLQNEISSLQKSLEKAQRAFDWLKKQKDLQNEQQEIAAQRQEVEAALRVLEPDRQRLLQHEKIVPHRSTFQQQAEEEKQIQRLQQELTALEKQVESGTEALQVLALKKDGQQKAQQLFEQEAQQKEQLLQKARKLQTQWETESKTLERLRQHEKELHLKKQTEQSKVEELSKQRISLKEAQEAGKRWLQANKVYAPLVEEDVLSEYRSLQQNWLEHHRRLQELQQRQKLLQRQESEAVSAQKNTEQERASQKQRARQEQQAFEQLLQSDDPNEKGQTLFAELRDRRENEAQRLTRLQQLLEKVEQRDTKTEQLGQLKQDLSSIVVELKQLEDQMYGLVMQKDDCEQHLKELNEEAQQLSLYLSLAEHRAQLQEEEACPLCGSTEHPYIEEGAPFENVETEKGQLPPRTLELIREKQANLESRLKAYQRDYEEVQSRQRKLEQACKSKEEQRELVVAELEQLEEEVANTQKAINAQRQAPDSLEGLQQAIQAQKRFLADEKKRIDDLQRHWESWQKARSTLEHLQQQLEQQQKQVEERQSQLAELGKEQIAAQSARSEKEAALREKLQSLNRTLDVFSEKALENLLQALKDLRDSYKKQQQEQQEKAQTIELLEQDWKRRQENLEELAQEWASAQENRQKQSAATEALQQEQAEVLGGESITAYEQALKSKRQQLQAVQQQLEKEQQEKALAQERNKSRLEEKGKRLVQMQQALKDSLDELRHTLQGLGFADLQAAKAVLLDASTAERLKADLQAQEQQKQHLEETAKRLRQKQAALAAEQLTTASEQELLEQLELLEAQKADLLRQEGQLENRLSADAKLRADAQALIEKVETQRQELKRWSRLSDLIGKSPNSKGRHKFRDFAQGITLDKLLRFTNQHLRVFFNERYELRRNSDTSLEIDIVDTFQARAQRRLSTLSGGETFLVSLSLALGLSDLASHQADLRSLFVDEGFGSLDADTLNVAMTALHALEAKGKSIGIISHVAKLKERIATQVRVRKMGSGFSSVRVVTD